MSKAAVGNMAGCYFVGRQELLNWMSGFLSEPIPNVEACSSGHQYCEMLYALYGSSVNLTRVRWFADLEWQKAENLKIVQEVLTNHGVDQVVDVGNLSKGGYSHNLEFLQWFKHFFDNSYDYSKPYDAVAVREHFCKARPQKPIPKVSNTRNSTSTTGQNAKPSGAGISNAIGASTTAQSPLREQVAQLTKRVEELTAALDKKTRGSKFYFNKLRDIEIYCGDLRDKKAQMDQDPSSVNPEELDIIKVIEHIESILYATNM